jgi:hypothetical protein
MRWNRLRIFALAVIAMIVVAAVVSQFVEEGIGCGELEFAHIKSGCGVGIAERQHGLSHDFLHTLYQTKLPELYSSSAGDTGIFLPWWLLIAASIYLASVTFRKPRASNGFNGFPVNKSEP